MRACRDEMKGTAGGTYQGKAHKDKIKREIVHGSGISRKGGAGIKTSKQAILPSQYVKGTVRY